MCVWENQREFGSRKVPPAFNLVLKYAIVLCLFLKWKERLRLLFALFFLLCLTKINFFFYPSDKHLGSSPHSTWPILLEYSPTKLLTCLREQEATQVKTHSAEKEKNQNREDKQKKRNLVTINQERAREKTDRIIVNL